MSTFHRLPLLCDGHMVFPPGTMWGEQTDGVQGAIRGAVTFPPPTPQLRALHPLRGSIGPPSHRSFRGVGRVGTGQLGASSQAGGRGWNPSAQRGRGQASPHTFKGRHVRVQSGYSSPSSPCHTHAHTHTLCSGWTAGGKAEFWPQVLLLPGPQGVCSLGRGRPDLPTWLGAMWTGGPDLRRITASY